MKNIYRKLSSAIETHLERDKSILLLGPRQTGKTTLLDGIPADLKISLVSKRIRLQYEKDPSLLIDQVKALKSGSKKIPLVIVDEVQKVPALLDEAQEIIDGRYAKMILTGSSARKLRRGKEVNLLPGRLVALRLDPLLLSESHIDEIDEAIYFGGLPAIRTTNDLSLKDTDLNSYVESYLEEEVREEALVRDVGTFARFLELAAIESGKIVNFSAIASDVGISSPTIQSHYEILEDCLIAERIEPITYSASRKKLTKSSRFLFFDLGVRRLAAGEGRPLDQKRKGELFEQFIGLELIHICRLYYPQAKIKYWRDPDGPEVDYVIELHGHYLPIEVKWTDRPKMGDIKHLLTFISEYDNTTNALVICRTEHPQQIHDRVCAISWKNLEDTLLETLKTK